MTTVFDRPSRGPAMHAFIAGVGAYRHCGPGADHPLLSRLEDLPAARLTALAMAEWLLDTQSDDPGVPLASVELLVSGTSPVSFRGKEVAPATHDRVEESYDRWYRRCYDPDSVALFYFAGHGYTRDPAREMLLLEDFGALTSSPFTGSVNFTALYHAMAYCQARTQCFFVDSCREIPLALEPMTQLGGFAPAPFADSLGGRTTALRLHATRYGEVAYAPPDRPTRFSEAVRSAFDGGAATQQPGGSWYVAADLLGPSAQRYLSAWSQAAPGGPGTSDQWVMPESDGPAATGAVLRTLPGPPPVPFRLGCDPGEALDAAELSLVRVRGDDVARQRPPDPRPWHGTVPAGVYDLHAHFPQQEWHDGVRQDLLALPPYLDDHVRVTRR